MKLPSHLSEEWRVIEGTDGAYEVSDHGRVRSWNNTHRVRQAEPHIIGRPDVNGYTMFSYGLPSGGTMKQRAHVAVCTAFHGPRPEGPGRIQVRHLDNDKTNARADNLAWGTHKENAQDRVKAGTSAAGEKNPWAKLTNNDVASIRALVNDKWISEREAAMMFGVTVANIRLIIKRVTWKAVL
jgi:hypothetical protein